MQKPYRTRFTVFGALGATLLVAGCGMGGNWWDRDNFAPPATVSQSAQPKPQRASVFSLPRFGIPRLGNIVPGAMPASEKQCREQLRRMGVKFTDIERIRDNANCGIDYPVSVTGLSGGIAMKPAARLNCQTALAVAEWIRDDVAPAARRRYVSGIREVRQMSSYSCRRIGGRGQWSEHSKGNALDIGAFELKNGRVIDVAVPSLFAIRAKGFLKSVRAQACGRFGTVLGPGDRDHHDHFHFDLRQRKRPYCSL